MKAGQQKMIYRDEGVAVTQLMKEYNIPIATLYRKIKGIYTKNMAVSLRYQRMRRISLLMLLVLLLIGGIHATQTISKI